MRYVWTGTENLTTTLQIDFTQDMEHLERGLNQVLAHCIRDAMKDQTPFFLEHHPFEDHGRDPGGGQPKAPDLAFILRANLRASFPIEAKVLDTDGAVADYVKEINDNFLECRYAPFSSHGAMLGYLRKGTVDNVIQSVQKSIGCTLVLLEALEQWKHHTSKHQRVSANCNGCPTDFTCHHMILLLPTGPAAA
ncbi:MAG: hypothetical protein JWP89_6335 [Schlesneria sp.]|nr:hypothetical protein [Schlesneria sp.]